MASSSEGSAPLSTTSGGGSGGDRHGMLVSKVLTYSDVSTEVARTGRIVLPRIQVQQCLPELLRLCQAEHALPAVRNGGPVKLSVDLVIVDEAGRSWVVLMKTWQNVVSGENRPTFVLENTADFVRANRLCQGHTLAFCPSGTHMLLRTSLRPDQLLPRQLKRNAATAAAAGRGASSAPAAKRRAPGGKPTAAPAPAGGASMQPESAFAAAAFAAAAGGRKRKAAAPPAAAAWTYCEVPSPQTPAELCWDHLAPQAAQAAAAALVEMHAGSNLSTAQTEQLAAAYSHAATGSGSGQAATPSPPLPTTGGAAPAASPAAGLPAAAGAAAGWLTHPIHRPLTVHGGSTAGSSPGSSDLLTRVQQGRNAAAAAPAVSYANYDAQSVVEQAAAALAAAVPRSAAPSPPAEVAWLPPAPPLSSSLLPPAHHSPDSGTSPAAVPATAVLPPEALAQVCIWLEAIIAQQQREREQQFQQQEQQRRWVAEYNQLLLLQQLQEHQRYMAGVAAHAHAAGTAALGEPSPASC